MFADRQIIRQGDVDSLILTNPIVPTASKYATKRSDLQRLDRVRISNGDVLIVTGTRSQGVANLWSGVKENGLGKEYIFGPKHRPEKIGVVTEDHKALKAMASRKEDKGIVGPEFAQTARALAAAVLAGKYEQATQLALALE